MGRHFLKEFKWILNELTNFSWLCTYITIHIQMSKFIEPIHFHLTPKVKMNLLIWIHRAVLHRFLKCWASKVRSGVSLLVKVRSVFGVVHECCVLQWSVCMNEWTKSCRQKHYFLTAPRCLKITVEPLLCWPNGMVTIWQITIHQ